MYNRYSHPLSHPHFDEAGTVSSSSLIGTLRAKGEQFQIMKTQVGRELHIEVNTLQNINNYLKGKIEF